MNAAAAFADVLGGVRVVDFCWVGAGALVTKALADAGAEVIKVESRARPDNLRTAPPFKDDVEGLERSGYFASRNTSKKSFALNMKHPRAREIALGLAACSDVVTNNFRPGVMERWGLAFEDVRAVNAAVVYLSMPMQGNSGPHRDYVGFGSTIQALSGLTGLSGLPERAPVGTGTHYPDHVPNPGHALVALLAALIHRRRTGEGQEIELSQLESTVNVLGPAILAESAGVPVGRTGNRTDDACPRGVFPCAGEDDWCALEVKDDEDWQRLVEVLGSPAWAARAELGTHAGRKQQEDELERALADETRGWDKWELMARLQERGVRAGAVETSRDLLEVDPHLRARGVWHAPPHEVLGPMPVNCAPYRVNGQAVPPRSAAPLLGEHTRALARDLLGVDDDEFERLEADELFV